MSKNDYVEMSATCFIEAFSHPEFWSAMDYDSNDVQFREHIFGRDGVIERVVRSQKFFFGYHEDLQNADALRDTAQTFHINGINILPFSDCWFEWEHWGGNPGGPRIPHFAKSACLISRYPGTNCISFQHFGAFPADTRSILRDISTWWFSGVVLELDDDGTITWWPCRRDRRPMPSRSDFDTVQRSISCMAALLARETKIVEKNPPSSLVMHHTKKGMGPLFSHKVVTIDPSRIVYTNASSRIGGEDFRRASPRLHWRRGHVRTLVGGKKVGVPPCIVGSVKNGILDKTYRIKPQVPDADPAHP